MNINSLNRKNHQLEIEVLRDKPLFISLVEVWLRDEELGSVSIEGYQLVDSFCRVDQRGGGSALWARADITPSPLNLREFSLEGDFEVCGLSWSKSGSIHKMISIYRAPTGNFPLFLERLEHILQNIFSPDCYIWVIADFNINFKVQCYESAAIVNLARQFGLEGIVRDDTRTTNVSSTRIDNIFTNATATSQTRDSHLSDHKIITVSIHQKLMENNSKRSNMIYTRNYCENNKNLFKITLGNESWPEVYEVEDLNKKFSGFIDKFLHHFNSCFPLHKKTLKPHKKDWVTEEVKSSSARLKDLYLLQKNHPQLKNYYRQRKREHRSFVENTKKAFYNEQILTSDNKNKTSWSIINKLRNKSINANTNITIIDKNNLISSPEKVANVLNDSFLSTPVNIVQSIPHTDIANTPTKHNPHSFVFIPYTKDEIITIFSKLKNKKSKDMDGLSTAFIKLFSGELAAPLCYLINTSMALGVFPDRLKVNKVIPLYKKNDRQCAENYRPISISSVFAKIFECAVLDRVLSFIDKFNLIPKEQHGFRKNKSTITAISEFYMNIMKELDGKKYPIGVFCDLSRAFDCVPHQRLLEKLEALGFRESVNGWFRTYLTDRYQFVEVPFDNGATSQDRESRSTMSRVSMGVPQGSVLAPTLFSLYISDIVLYLKDYMMVINADDSSFLVCEETPHENNVKCNALFERLGQWFSINQLFLNTSKTEYVVFHPRQKTVEQINIIWHDMPIKRSTYAKFLGLHVEENICWRVHGAELEKKINKSIYQLRCLYSVLDTEVLKHFYFAEIQSRITYGILIWGSSSILKDIFLLQKKCIRAILGKGPQTSCKPLFKILKILPLCCLYIIEVSCYIFKIKHSIPCHGDVHRHGTRNRFALYPPQNRIDLSQKSPYSQGIRIYNRLDHLHGSTTCASFRTNLKKWLQEECFYTLDEFFL